jgi:ankyrin repeat protein
LALAIINAHYQLAAELLDHGADPNINDARGSALHALTWMRNRGLPDGDEDHPPKPSGNLDSLELAKILLTEGANPNARIAWKEIPWARNDGNTRAPPGIRIYRTYISDVGATPFYLAAKQGDAPLMRLLVEYGAHPQLATAQNVTPLMAAAGLGYYDGESPSPSTDLLETERLEAVKLAWELGGDVNAATDFGIASIEGDSLALLYDYYDYPDNLLGAPETAVGDVRWDGMTALHGAANMSEQHSIIEFLVEKGARLDARNKLGWTPLMLTEGVKVNTVNYAPGAAELLRRLMRERNLDPELYSQKGYQGREPRK